MIRHHDLFNVSFIANTLFPVTTHTWWYITAYAEFILLLPFILKGLHAIHPNWHAVLCILILFTGTFLQELPWIPPVDMDNVWVLVQIFVLISYVKWYMKLPTARVGVLFLSLGFVISFAQNITGYITFETNLNVATLLKAGGLFIIFSHLCFKNKWVNSAAQLTLGVYLISEYPFIRSLLWCRIFSFAPHYELRPESWTLFI